jgi:hypothetical protein
MNSAAGWSARLASPPANSGGGSERTRGAICLAVEPRKPIPYEAGDWIGTKSASGLHLPPCPFQERFHPAVLSLNRPVAGTSSACLIRRPRSRLPLPAPRPVQTNLRFPEENRCCRSDCAEFEFRRGRWYLTRGYDKTYQSRSQRAEQPFWRTLTQPHFNHEVNSFSVSPGEATSGAGQSQTGDHLRPDFYVLRGDYVRRRWPEMSWACLPFAKILSTSAAGRLEGAGVI